MAIDTAGNHKHLENTKEMLDYAYKNQNIEVVMLTRKLNWYKEEMFARFVPYKFEGNGMAKMLLNFTKLVIGIDDICLN
jgi:hypothetical protein